MNKAAALKTAAFLARGTNIHKRINAITGALEPKNGRLYHTEQATIFIRELVAEVEAQDALLQQAVEALEQAKHNTTHGQIAWNCKEVIAAIRQHRERKQ